MSSVLPALAKLGPVVMAFISGDPNAGAMAFRTVMSNPELLSLLSSVGQSSLGLLSS